MSLLVSGLSWVVVLWSEYHSITGSLSPWKYPGCGNARALTAGLPAVLVMASHGEDGLHRDILPSGCHPDIVLPCVLRADLPAVAVMAGHCNDGLTPLRQVASAVHETSPKQGVPAVCLQT